MGKEWEAVYLGKILEIAIFWQTRNLKGQSWQHWLEKAEAELEKILRWL